MMVIIEQYHLEYYSNMRRFWIEINAIYFAINTALYPIDQFESCHVQKASSLFINLYKAFCTLNKKSI